MITNKIHYQITGTFNTDFGTVITNPIIKIDVNSTGVISTGLLQCEYNVYISKEKYEEGFYFFKGHYNDERLVNFTYPIADVPTWGIQTYEEQQRKIIADTFGYDLENVVLVQEEV